MKTMELPSPEFQKRTLATDIKRRWLSHYFGKISMKKTDIITARLPHAYSLQIHPQDAEVDDIDFIVAAMTGKPLRMRFMPKPVEGTGFSTSAAICDLFTKARTQDIQLYAPKAGQTEGVIDPSKYYTMIYQEDPRHSHSNAPHLIDFVDARLVLGGLVKKCTLNGSHSHLLIA